MKFRATLALSAAVLLALSGCKTLHHLTHDDACNKPKAYQQATSIAPLTIPAGLSTPNTSAALDVPNLEGAPPPPRTVKDPCLAAPPSFNVPGATDRPGE